MPTMKHSEFHSILTKHGWTRIRQEGSHHVYEHTSGKRERLGLAGDQDMSAGGLKELFKRFGLPYQLGGFKDSNGAQKVSKPRGRAAPVKLAASGTLGRRIYEARNQAGISQMDLARKTGINQSVLSSWERGDVSPLNPDGSIRYKLTAPKLATLADLFGFTDIKEKTKGVVGGSPYKSAVEEALRPLTRVAEHVEESEEVVPSELEKELEALRRRHPDERAFAKLLQPSDIMQWILNLTDELRRVKLERDKLARLDPRILQRKARAYDALMSDAEKLIQRAKELESE